MISFIEISINPDCNTIFCLKFINLYFYDRFKNISSNLIIDLFSNEN